MQDSSSASSSDSPKVIGRPFKPGQSGNPSGKRKGTVSLRACAQRVLTPKDGEKLIQVMLAKALRGQIPAAKLLAELLGELPGSHLNQVNVGVRFEQPASPAIGLPWKQIIEQERALIAERAELADRNNLHSPGERMLDSTTCGEVDIVPLEAEPPKPPTEPPPWPSEFWPTAPKGAQLSAPGESALDVLLSGRS